MPTSFELIPRGPYAIGEAARFFRGWAPIDSPDGLVLPLALVRDDLEGVAGVAVRAEGGRVVGTLDRPDEADAVAAQVARILSLDVDATGFAEVGARDPVVGRFQAEAPGLRPVLFHTPYEAAAWAILSQRISMRQAGAIRRRLSEELGRPVEVAGISAHAFPLPADLLAAPALPGLPSVKQERLRALAEAALAGRLEAAELRALPGDEARARLQELPGIGPFSADLVLLRGCGTIDVVSLEEPRLRRIAAAAYGRPELERDGAALAALAEGWRPWRTWVSVLLRALGDG